MELIPERIPPQCFKRKQPSNGLSPLCISYSLGTKFIKKEVSLFCENVKENISMQKSKYKV